MLEAPHRMLSFATLRSIFPWVGGSMRRGLIIIIVAAALPVLANSANVYEEFRVGYANDFAVEVGFQVTDLSSELPIGIKGSLGYIRQVQAGNADDARSIFINDGTAGSPSEYGESWFYGFTVGYQIFAKDSFQLNLMALGRQNRYSAYFIFTGGNEAFRVTTTQFGLGGGAELVLRSDPRRTGFALSGGVEYYFPSRIDSHGTFFYTPDGTDERPRNDYTYADADASINQPVLRPFVTFAVLIPLNLN